MKEKIEEFYCRLMICGEGNKNEKELKLIDTLDSLLSMAEAGEQLNEERLGYARYKISRVSCFAEKYADIVDFLEKYEKNEL